MKKINIFLYMLLAVSLLTSCLKNDDNILDYTGIKPLVTIPKSNFPAKGVFATAVSDSAANVRTLNLKAHYAFQVPAPRDLKVTFIKDDALVAKYNSTFLTNYLPLPADFYQMSGVQATIPAGSQEAVIPINLDIEKMKGTKKYMIAFTLTDADGVLIADNLKSIVFALKGQ